MCPSHALSWSRRRRTSNRLSDGGFHRAVVTSPPTGGSESAADSHLPRPDALIIGDPQVGSARLQSTRPCARDVPRLVRGDCAARCRGHRAPAYRRRSLWLDRASARPALAVPPRRSSGASANVADVISALSPEPPVRSRRSARRGQVTPSVRTKFQAVALLLRDERARVRAADGSDSRRELSSSSAWTASRPILATTAVRDAGLLALLAEDSGVSDAAPVAPSWR